MSLINFPRADVMHTQASCYLQKFVIDYLFPSTMQVLRSKALSLSVTNRGFSSAAPGNFSNDFLSFPANAEIPSVAAVKPFREIPGPKGLPFFGVKNHPTDSFC